ncbi:hypothetical protein GLOIN_2v1474782 [Rhizophagus irregularis DAOM 181602=DAOM 197198]|uniref:Serine-enriched protein n=1 Tax=Rhizophagus irregularis (strain DAOM 181602 / DAOM 197198 / MUCL 43194) TaxID=747089 RepID=A0A2P4QF14_RHIID|nr:hypothetical protein GLOIN_2v1474782 [Rhizophagus irregularis DAOM 181602=DAOM 197198]POG76233.1 hypothetical protein GLOIN_2v1474782 [Rhizophagus irregularis DAOM 181602=DAOM 197198]|eukprot:XP_025183099.1 hypothetical protein GLOIN_2v1474782 [Rhizophagus irregularis DAOM 181602=DAOM 197198]
MAFEYSQEINNDLEKLFEAEEEYNVIIYSGENNNIKEFHAHSILLRIRSQYFRSAFSKERSEKKDGKYVFNFPNISPQFYKIILRFIYCGKIDLSKLQGPDILKLLIAVDELKIQTLILCIQEYLIKHQHEFLQQNPLEILETVYQRETFTNLWNYYLEEICAKPDTLFKSNKFTNLKAPLLELLLKRDDLSLDEIDIWDSLIKWGYAQHPSIQRDVKKWNKEEITIMERTLHKFIPLIRFYHVDSEDFFLKVYPFKILIPEDILDNVLAFHMAPSKKSSLNIQPPRKSKNVYGSVIIGPQHFAIFSSWIEKKDASRNIPYNFNLLYRASRDGNTAAAFHTKCDNKGATIVILKIPNSEHILGGYNPLQWGSNAWKSTRDSFLFSFTNKNDHNSAKVGHVNTDYGNAIYCHQNYGPAFGGGHDLFQDSDSKWKNYSGFYSYSEVDIPQSHKSGCYNIFDVEDYEVFQVIKK